MNKTKRTIQVIGKVCRIISTVLMVLTAIGAGFALTAGIVMAVVPTNTLEVDVKGSTEIEVSGKLVDLIPEDAVKEYVKQIEEGTTKVTLNGQLVTDAEAGANSIILKSDGTYVYLNLRKLGIVCIISSLIAACLVYVLVMLGKLMDKLHKCESPFEDGVVKAMSQFAISLIPYAVLKPTLTALSSSILTTGNVNVNFSFDTTTVFAALVVILMILIFKYGASLQKNEDETL